MTPDLWCFGKVIGGGLPVGAFGGRRDVLEVLAPSGPVYQAGTLSANPLTMAAGRAVLEHVSDADYKDLASRIARFTVDLQAAVHKAGFAVEVPRAGPLCGVFFSDTPVPDYEERRPPPAMVSTGASSLRCSGGGSHCPLRRMRRCSRDSLTPRTARKGRRRRRRVRRRDRGLGPRS